MKTRSEPPPSPASLAVGLTPRAKKDMFIRTTSPYLHFCCTNNRIVRKLASFAGKGGVRIFRNYTVFLPVFAYYIHGTADSDKCIAHMNHFAGIPTSI